MLDSFFQLAMLVYRSVINIWNSFNGPTCPFAGEFFEDHLLNGAYIKELPINLGVCDV